MHDVIFHPSHIAFPDYPIRFASVAKNPQLNAADIAEVRLQRWPPEVVTRGGEVLFVPRRDQLHLDLFARVNHIPIIVRQDVWGLVNEPCLDTEIDPASQKRTLEMLQESGFSTGEVTGLRNNISSSLATYNALAWEWTHLGHLDLLAAYGMDGRMPKLFRPTQAQYDAFNAVSNRGHVIDHKPWPVQDRARRMIDDLARDIVPAESEACDRLSRLLLDVVTAHHAEPHRHYHTLVHALNVAEFCNALSPNDRKQKHIPLRIAAWFHDIIYDPKSPTNEKDSTTLMRHTLRDWISENNLEEAEALIRMTKSHGSAKTPDEKILADADLSILAEETSAYQTYVRAIRQEYAHVDDAIFTAGRAKFLDAMLQRMKESGQLFTHLHPLHEHQAKVNLVIERERYSRPAN